MLFLVKSSKTAESYSMNESTNYEEIKIKKLIDLQYMRVLVVNIVSLDNHEIRT